MNPRAWLTAGVVALLAATSAVAAPARSSPPPPTKHRTIGILDVRVDGVPDDVRAQFEKKLEQQLETNHYWLANRTQMRDRMKFSTKWTEGCFVGPCLAEARTQTSAEIVVLAALAGSGTSFGFVVTIARTDTGKVLAQDASRCDVCTVSEAINEATLATIKLINNVPDRLPDDAGDQGAAIDVAVVPLTTQIAVARQRKSRLGIATTVVGLVVMGVGLTAYVGKDKPTYSYVLAGAGGGLAASGITILAF